MEELASVGSGAKPAVPVLLRMLRHQDRDVYLAAGVALHAIDWEAAAKAGVLDPPRFPQIRQTGLILVGDEDQEK
jgi:hypothetical protein